MTDELAVIADPVEQEESEAVQGGLTPREMISAWAEKHARGLLIALVVAILPYLLLCNGMALLVVSSLFSGSCTTGG